MLFVENTINLYLKSIKPQMSKWYVIGYPSLFEMVWNLHYVSQGRYTIFTKTKIVVSVSRLFCIVTLESKQFNAPNTALGKAYTFSKQLPIKCMRYLIILHFLLHLFRLNKTIVERKLKTSNQTETSRLEYFKTFPSFNEVSDYLV